MKNQRKNISNGRDYAITDSAVNKKRNQSDKVESDFEFSDQDLSAVPFFSDLSTEEFQRLRSFLTPRCIPSGTKIIRAGDTGTGVFILLRGKVKITLTDEAGIHTLVGFCGPGECLGEIDAIDGRGHSASVATAEACRFLWMSKDDFWDCQCAVPQVSRNLLLLLVQRERRNTLRLGSFSKLSLSGRIARQLLLLARDHGTPERTASCPPLPRNQSSSKNGTEMAGFKSVVLYLTQEELAAIVGSSRECVNRVLGQFKKSGYITVHRDGRIVICHAVALRQLAEIPDKETA